MILQPSVSQELIESFLKLQKADLKRDNKKFMKYLYDKAEICEKNSPLPNFKKVPAGSELGRSGVPKSYPVKASSTSSAVTSKDSTEKQKGPSKSAPLCLVPDSKEQHFVRDHRPSLPVEEQKHLISEFKKRKAGKANYADNNKVAAFRGTKEVTAPIHPGSQASRIDNTVVVVTELYGYIISCRNDSGSDVYASISDSIIKFLHKKGVFVPTRSLEIS